MGAAVLRWFPPGTRINQPVAGFCLWVELPPGGDAQALYLAALRAGISLTPGPLFSAKLRYRHFIRLSAARWSDALAPAVRRLGALVAGMAGGGRARRG
jgi:DNA-binding transcriptional MocR family regulator